MMLPPRSPSRLEDPRTALELELAGVHRELAAIGAALKNPLAWIALELLAIATDQAGPLERLRSLWFAEALLEASLAWHRGRRHELGERELEGQGRARVRFAAIVSGDRIELEAYADATLEEALAFLRPAWARTWWAWDPGSGEDLDLELEIGTLELAGETIIAVPRT